MPIDKHAAAAVKTAAPRMAAVAHMGVVRGVATDGLNRLLVSVGSDAKLKVGLVDHQYSTRCGQAG